MATCQTKTILLLLAMLCASPIWAQRMEDALLFDHLTTQQGLSQDIVTAIAQDKHGFMWIGTEDGLNRYDGIRMKIYRNDFSDPTTISDNWIRKILSDSDGNLWVCTHNGLSLYNPTLDNFQQFHHKPDQPNSSLPSNYLISICEYKGNIWVGTGDKGIARYNKADGQFRVYRHSPDDPNSLPNDEILTMHVDRSGILWIGTNNGFCRYDERLDRFVLYKKGLKQHDSIVNYEVRTIYEDAEGKIWIGTGNAGLSHFNENLTEIVKYSQQDGMPVMLEQAGISTIFEDDTRALWIGTTQGALRKEYGSDNFRIIKNTALNPKSLSNNDVSCFFEDQSRMLWVGTRGGGINIYDVHRKEFIHYKHDYKNPNSLTKDVVRAIFDDGEGTLWIGLREGAMDRLNRNTGEFTHVPSDRTKQNALWGETVSAIYKDSRGDLWVGSWGDGLNRYNSRTKSFEHFLPSNKPGSITDNRIQAILEDKDGEIWVATDGGINKFVEATNSFINYTHDPANPNSLSDNTVQGQAFVCDDDGYIWIGTYAGHLDRFDKRTNTFAHYKAGEGAVGASLPGKGIISLLSQNDVLWIGTDGGGFCRLNKYTELIKCYTTENGLPSNVIYGIKEDKQGQVWMSTKNGLCRFSPTRETFTNYYDYHGLQSNVFYWGAAHSNKSGEMFFGGINGLSIFDPEKIEENSYVPPVYITSFKLNNEVVPIGVLDNRVLLEKHISITKKIALDYTDRFFAFGFAALNYSHPERNLYRYKMEGFDDDWRTTDAHNAYAPYTNLPSGRYTFKVMGANNDGVWNTQPVEIEVTMTPPWWQTWWTRGFAIVFLLGMAYTMYIARLRRLQRQKLVLLEQVRARTAEILEKNGALQQQQTRIVRQNQKIQSSINYAQRIQKAMMPTAEEIDEALSEHFILFAPRDVVSGDFYWMSHKENKTFLAAVDCTGHGVPGAFMSMVGLDLLKETVNMREISDASKILEELHMGVRHTLHQEENKNRDGMDMTLCVIEQMPNGNIHLQYAGAHNPLVYVQNGELKVFKADKLGIGGEERGGGKRTYTKHCLEITEPTEIYLYSDGYQDQFGGKEGRKLMSKNFKRLLLSIHEKPMAEQRVLLEAHMNEWKGRREQTDDILVIGVRLIPSKKN